MSGRIALHASGINWPWPGKTKQHPCTAVPCTILANACVPAFKRSTEPKTTGGRPYFFVKSASYEIPQLSALYPWVEAVYGNKTERLTRVIIDAVTVTNVTHQKPNVKMFAGTRC